MDVLGETGKELDRLLSPIPTGQPAEVVGKTLAAIENFNRLVEEIRAVVKAGSLTITFKP